MEAQAIDDPVVSAQVDGLGALRQIDKDDRVDLSDRRGRRPSGLIAAFIPASAGLRVLHPVATSTISVCGRSPATSICFPEASKSISRTLPFEGQGGPGLLRAVARQEVDLGGVAGERESRAVGREADDGPGVLDRGAEVRCGE